MKYDKKREHRRKERAQYEVERMIRRYSKECGACLTRCATPEELEAVEPAEKRL